MFPVMVCIVPGTAMLDENPVCYVITTIHICILGREKIYVYVQSENCDFLRGKMYLKFVQLCPKKMYSSCSKYLIFII